MCELQQIAASYLEAFKSRTRDGGERYYYLDDKNEYLVLQDFIRDEVHEGYLPDDFKYKTVHACFEAVAEGFSSLEEVIDYVGTDDRYFDLLSWSASHLNRIDYVNQVLEETSLRSYTDILSHAQYLEVYEICSQTFNFLEEQVQATYDCQEEDEYE